MTNEYIDFSGEPDLTEALALYKSEEYQKARQDIFVSPMSLAFSKWLAARTALLRATPSADIAATTQVVAVEYFMNLLATVIAMTTDHDKLPDGVEGVLEFMNNQLPETTHHKWHSIRDEAAVLLGDTEVPHGEA